MKKILFLHGFYASGQCVPAVALKEAFEGEADVITPDLPIHPKEAVRFIRGLIDSEKPDLLIGNSCGSFYAQMVAPVVGVPALLGNPHFQMTEFLKQRIGEHQYKLFNSITVIPTSKTEFGDCSVKRTRWHTLNQPS